MMHPHEIEFHVDREGRPRATWKGAAVLEFLESDVGLSTSYADQILEQGHSLLRHSAKGEFEQFESFREDPPLVWKSTGNAFAIELDTHRALLTPLWPEPREESSYALPTEDFLSLVERWRNFVLRLT
jgi:hypothetical protein